MSDLRRIAFFIRALIGGGAQRDTILLANALAARGIAVDLITMRPDGPLRALVAREVAIVPIGGGKLRAAVPGLRRALLARRPDALVSAEAAPNLVALLAVKLMPKGKRPRLVLREVAAPSIALAADPYRQNRFAYRALRHLYRFADVVVALTDGARDDLINNFAVPPERVVKIAANAVIDTTATNMLEAPRENGLIVSIGRLSPEKDHATLIRAFVKLKGDLRLTIAGEGPEHAALQALIGTLGVTDRVQLAGFVADPFSLLRRAELAVSSSRYEGFGNAIVEALACGTPVVATDCPYGPREILAAGRFGTLVPVGDADALAAAMTQALAAPPDRAALRARASLHTVARAADALLAIINTLGRPAAATHTRLMEQTGP